MAWQVRLLRASWLAGLALLLAVPLWYAAAAVGGVWGVQRLAVLSGVLAASALVATTVLPSRLTYLTLAFGIERVLRSHRRAGLLAAAVVLAHVAFVLAEDAGNLRLLDLRTAPHRAQAAVTATVGIVVLCVLAMLRRARRHYTLWRLVHVGVALAVLLLSALHVLWLDHLVRDVAMRRVLAAMAGGLVLVLAYRWLWEPFAARTRPFVVDEVRDEGPTTSTVVISPRHGWQRGVRFAPGQFAWLRLDSPFALTEEHPFSIASGAQDHRRLEFTVREAGDFTRELRRLRPGRVVYLDGPHGSFTVDHQRTDGVVMICAGVGITPMISMLRTFAHRGDRRRHLLVTSARTPDDLLFRAEIQALRLKLDLDVVEVLSQPPVGWTGYAGRVDEFLLHDVLPRRGRRRLSYFLCGPPAMVRRTADSLRRLSIPEERVHTEQFDMA
jgi:3-phenylpropionate/trans-cinnamate dioxygenase ferredoxin reductase subunit